MVKLYGNQSIFHGNEAYKIQHFFGKEFILITPKLILIAIKLKKYLLFQQL